MSDLLLFVGNKENEIRENAINQSIIHLTHITSVGAFIRDSKNRLWNVRKLNLVYPHTEKGRRQKAHDKMDSYRALLID